MRSGQATAITWDMIDDDNVLRMPGFLTKNGQPYSLALTNRKGEPYEATAFLVNMKTRPHGDPVFDMTNLREEWRLACDKLKLGMFDPTTDTLTELPVPALSGGPPALYALVIDRKGDIWFVDVGANTLVRYVPEKQTLTFVQLSLPSSAPFGLTLDPAGNLWFTAGGSSANYVGEIAP